MIDQPTERDTQSKSDKKTLKRDKPVTSESVTRLYACVLQVLKSDPDRKRSPKEIATILHQKPASVRQALKRLSSPGKGGGLVIKIDYGLYQYSPEKNGRLSTLISRSGRVGIENLTYVTLGSRYPECQAEITEKPLETGSKRDNHPSMKPGYPRHLSTGQEIRWERWENGSERLSFISHGNPFSVDLILYLHEELVREGFGGDEWKRVSIEVNRDGQTLTLNPECMTLQDTQGVLLKAYNHGKQVRFEAVDRTPATMKDTLSLFLGIVDEGTGKTALREVREQSEILKRIDKTARTALNVATSVRDGQGRSGRKARKDPVPAFRTGAETVPVKVS